jgi:hypothetical protein
MPPYSDALNAMHDLLGALGEQHWRAWIAQDIDEWESHKSVSHHLSAYGGMGSFNDIGFEDVWLGVLFDDLKSACYYFAHQPTSKPDITGLERSMGCVSFELSGWRCLVCGYGVISHRNIDYFIARRIIRQNVVAEAGRAHLREFVASAIRSHPTDVALTPAKVVSWVDGSGLHIRDSNEWLRPCPNCGSEDTAVYRWLLADGEHRFVPAHDNLRLRTGAA